MNLETGDAVVGVARVVKEDEEGGDELADEVAPTAAEE
jgi:hypothetical protein